MDTINRKIAPKIDFIDELKNKEIDIRELPNGIKLYFIKSSNNDISELIWHFNKGVWSQSNLLVATMTAKLITEGTKSLNSEQIADTFDYCGANFSKVVSMHSTSFKLLSLNKYIPKLVSLVADILSNPLFDEMEFQILKNENKQKFLIDLEEVSTIARFTFEKNLFGSEHPYGWIAKPENYDKLKLDWLKAFYDANYVAKNLSIIIVTNEVDKTYNSIYAEFGDFRNNNTIIDQNLTPVKPLKKYEYISNDTSFQSALRLGWRLFNRQHADYQNMLIFDALLGGYFGSRLMQNIRQKLGLTYSIYSSVKALKYDGSFQIISEVNKENKEKVIDEIINEIEKLKNEPVSKNELNNLKNYLLGSLLSSIDGNFNYATALSSFLTYNTDFNFYSNFVTTIKEMNPDIIKNLANKYFDINNMFKVVVG